MHRSWYHLLYVLRTKGAALQQLIDATVYPALLISIRPATGERYAPPGVPPSPQQRHQPCRELSTLWRSLQTDQHGEWIARRRQEEMDKDAKKDIAKRVYTRLWKAVVEALQTLRLDLELSEGEEQQQAQQEGNEEDNDVEGEIEGGSRPQAVGMTGRERPQSPEDFGFLLNTVDVCRILLRGLEPGLFDSASAYFCRAMVQLSSRYPLVSAFFKLLALAMNVIERGGWYKSFSLQQLHGAGSSAGGERKEFQSEEFTCFVVTVKFAREVMKQSEQYFDDLKAACLEFVLALPSPMLDLPLQVPALKVLPQTAPLLSHTVLLTPSSRFKAALSMGTSVPYIAGVALDCLERWVRCSTPGLGRHLPEILPLLELYLVKHEELEDGFTRTVDSMQKKQRRAKYLMKKGAAGRQQRAAMLGEEAADDKEMAMRAVRLLGQLGSISAWLSEDGKVEASEIIVSAKLLKLEIRLGDGEGSPEVELPLDNFLLRVMHLAENSPDRKTKVRSRVPTLIHLCRA